MQASLMLRCCDWREAQYGPIGRTQIGWNEREAWRRERRVQRQGVARCSKARWSRSGVKRMEGGQRGEWRHSRRARRDEAVSEVLGVSGELSFGRGRSGVPTDVGPSGDHRPQQPRYDGWAV